MRCSIRWALLTAALCACWQEAALARSGPLADAADEPSDVVVTGRSLEQTLPQELANLGNQLEIVDEQRLRDTGAVDVATVLRNVPGVFIQPGSGPFDYVDVAIQGSRTADVLWTLDGIRLNNRLYGSTSPNDTLPASMVERIEVLKGGESLFYGTQAAAGVINVVTRSFADTFGGRFDANVDSFAGTNVGGYLRDGFGDHRVVVWGSYNRTDGFRPYSAYQPSATDRLRGYDLWSVGGKYQFDIGSGWQLNVQWIHTDAKLDNITPTRVRESRNDRNEEIGSVRLDYTGSDTVQLFLKGYYHDWRTAYVQILNDTRTLAPVVVYSPGTFWGYKDYGGSALVKLHPHRGLEYLIGYDFQKFNGRDDVLLIGKTSERVHAGAFQVRTTDELTERLHLAAGLRYNDGSGARKTIWNASGRFDVTPNLYVQASGGTSFRLPSASELYQIDPCCELGNPNLKPEESINVNAGVGGSFGEGAITFAATYFQRRIKDLITIDFDNPAFPDGIYANGNGRTRVRGVEAQAGVALGRGFLANASYTWTRARSTGSDLQVNRIPEEIANASLSWAPQEQRFGVNATVNWVGDVYSSATGIGRLNYGDYAVVDAGAHLYLDADRRHRFGVNVENLFDRDYATRGFQTSLIDNSTSRFTYYRRGVPRTLRVSYGVQF